MTIQKKHYAELDNLNQSYYDNQTILEVNTHLI